MDRQTFTMTAEQYAKMLQLSRPTAYLVMGGRPPMSVQERMNRAWDELGDEMGFIGSSARAIGSGDPKRFSAIPKEKKSEDVSAPSPAPSPAPATETYVPMAAYFSEPPAEAPAPAYKSGGGGDFSGGGATGSYDSASSGSDSGSSGGGGGGD